MGKGALGGFAAGLLVGVDRGIQRKREQEIEDQKLAREQERYDADKRERDQRYADNMALREAAAPVEVKNGATVTGLSSGTTTYDNADVAASDVRQARSLGEGGTPMQQGQDPSQFALSQPVSATPAPVVNGSAFGNAGDAGAAAAALNTPEAMAGRVATALQKQGKPTEALQFQQMAQKYADTQWDRELREAMAKGHQGLAQFMTRSQGGVFAGKNITAVPSADGKTVTYSVVNADGTVTPTPYTLPNDQNGVIAAAYQLAKIDPETRYRHMVEEDKRAKENDRKDQDLKLRERTLDEVKVPAAEAKVALSQAQAALAEAKATAGGKNAQDKTDSEDRKRWTTLLDESGRRLSDSNKALRTLQRDPVFMARANKQGSPESLELQGLRDDVKRYDQDRATYQELLSRGGGAAARPARQRLRPLRRPPARRARCRRAPRPRATTSACRSCRPNWRRRSKPPRAATRRRPSVPAAMWRRCRPNCNACASAARRPRPPRRAPAATTRWR
jgi:hypothetical protein